MEDSVVELERDRALRKLSGSAEASEDNLAAEPPASITPLTEQAVKAVQQDRPSLEHARRPSSETSHRRQRTSSQAAGPLSHGRGHSRSQSSASAHLFAAHKVVNPFGTPNGSHFVSHSQRAAKEGNSGTAKPKLRDIFAKKGEGEDGWVDDDEGASTYTGGFGQSSARATTSTAFLDTSAGLSQAPGSPVPAQGGSVFGEGRYAGVGAMARGECAPTQGGPNGRRPGQTVKGPSFKRSTTVVEEEEEEE